jgi:ankyrin repeat protein
MRHPRADPDLVDTVHCLKLLQQHGASINAVNDNGDTPVSFAIASSLDTILEFLLSDPDVHLGEPAPGCTTPAQLAQKLGRHDVASTIVTAQVSMPFTILDLMFTSLQLEALSFGVSR